VLYYKNLSKENLINKQKIIHSMLVQSFSGIRGIYNKELNEDIARRYAYVFNNFLKKSNKNPLIVIGNDPRQSSEPLKKAMFDVFDNIIDIGIATTPMIELAVREYKADGGIIITASHNEPEYNGFKFLDKDGALLRPDDINKVIDDFNNLKELEETDFLNNFLYKEEKTVHKIDKRHDELIDRYYNFLIKIIKKENIELIKNSNFKIILDPNGGSAIIAKDILEKIGIEVIGINMEYGKFIRQIEPNNESLSYLKNVIKKEKVIAAGFDCDGDRIEILTENKEMISGQYVLALVVDEILSSIKNPEKQIIVTNDVTSNLVKEISEKYNAKIKETEVGEINVVDEMLKNNSAVGGEGSSSGGIISPSRCRDGILTLIMILKMMEKRKKTLSEIIKDYPIYFSIRKNIKYNPEEHDKIKRALKEHYSKKYKIQETGDITGGLKVLIDDKSFLWFRASKTESNVFRIIADSNEKEKCNKLLEDGIKIFNSIK